MTSDAEFSTNFTATGWERYADTIRSWLENTPDNPVLLLPIHRQTPAGYKSWDTDPLGHTAYDVVRLDRHIMQAPCPWTDNPAVYRWWFATDTSTGRVVVTSSAFRLDAGDYWARVAQAYGPDVLAWPHEVRWAHYRELRARQGRPLRRGRQMVWNWRSR